MAAWAAANASNNGGADYLHFITSLDVLTGEGGGGDEARAAALIDKHDKFSLLLCSLCSLDGLSWTGGCDP